MLPNIPRDRTVAFDVETTGLNFRTDKMFGLSVAWRNQGKVESHYVDIRRETALHWACEQLPKARLLTGWHSKFDCHFCREAGITLPLDRVDCAMIREALINEHRLSYSLDAIAFLRLGKRKHDAIWALLAEKFGGQPSLKAQIHHLSEAPFEWVEAYARPDAELALEIWEDQQKDIVEQELELVHSLERRLFAVIIGMESRGVGVDVEFAHTEMEKLDVKIRGYQETLNKSVGREFNVNSTPQVRKLLRPEKDEKGYWRLPDGTLLDSTQETPEGADNPSLKSDYLRKSNLPECKMIVDIRSLTKTRDVFLKTYILEHGASGRIHASFNQTRTEYGAGTGTGRFSITEPALQQIPARDDKVSAITRSCFIPDTGDMWGCWDWRQVEFRAMAHYTNEPAIIAAYAADPNTDYHAIVAQITGLPRDRDEKTGGANSKQINLGLVFGEGAGRMAKEMGYSFYKDERGYIRAGPEAQEIFDRYHEAIPGVRKMLKTAESVAKSRGYIKTPLGRHIRFPGGKGAHTAAGLLFQSTAADMMKLKLCELDDLLQGTDAKLLLTVHDEFNISIPPRALKLRDDITEVLSRFDGNITPIQLRVPITSSAGFGENWYQAGK